MTLRLIREEEPPRPSTRLSESKHTLAAISAQRKLEPARLARELRGDLDWIVMKALEKDRTRRYETANSLARDIERYLHEEAVEACPPSAAYKLRKFAHKNRKLLSVAAAFVLLLTAATAVSVWLAVWATFAERAPGRERDRAEAEAKRARRQGCRFLVLLWGIIDALRLYGRLSPGEPRSVGAFCRALSPGHWNLPKVRGDDLRLQLLQSVAPGQELRPTA